jgi:hypothetical protein
MIATVRFRVFFLPSCCLGTSYYNIQTIILPLVLCGYENWSLTSREEHRLKLSENRVLRGIFGPKRDVVTGEWRKFHSGVLHKLYSSLDNIRQKK